MGIILLTGVKVPRYFVPVLNFFQNPGLRIRLKSFPSTQLITFVPPFGSASHPPPPLSGAGSLLISPQRYCYKQGLKAGACRGIVQGNFCSLEALHFSFSSKEKKQLASRVTKVAPRRDELTIWGFSLSLSFCLGYTFGPSVLRGKKGASVYNIHIRIPVCLISPLLFIACELAFETLGSLGIFLYFQLLKNLDGKHFLIIEAESISQRILWDYTSISILPSIWST